MPPATWRRGAALAADAAARRKASAGAPGVTAEQSDDGDPARADVVRRGPGTDGSTRVLDRDSEPPREVRSNADFLDTDEPPEPTTVVGALRFVALGAHLVLAATFVWFVVESRRASPSSTGGGFNASDLDRLDLVRTANVVAFVVTVLLVGAWGFSTSVLAKRAGRAAPSPFVVLALCVPGTLLVLVALVVDGRVGDGFVFVLAVLAAALGGAGALVLLSTMSRNVEARVHGMHLWAAVIAVVGLGLTIGGYLQSIGPDDSLGILTLVAVVTSIVVSAGVLLGAPASGELDDDTVDQRPLESADLTG